MEVAITSRTAQQPAAELHWVRQHLPMVIKFVLCRANLQLAPYIRILRAR